MYQHRANLYTSCTVLTPKKNFSGKLAFTSPQFVCLPIHASSLFSDSFQTMGGLACQLSWSFHREGKPYGFSVPNPIVCCEQYISDSPLRPHMSIQTLSFLLPW
jgi:hypothetical protein